MDSSIVVMTAIIIAILLIPVVISFTKSKRNKVQLSKILNAIAGEHKASISTFKTSRGMTFGITDDNANFVFYKKDDEDVTYKYFVPLHEIKSCELIKTASGDGIGKLALRFVFRDNSRPTVNIGFYDRNEHFQIADELELIEKCKQQIDAALSSLKENEKVLPY